MVKSIELCLLVKQAKVDTRICLSDEIHHWLPHHIQNKTNKTNKLFCIFVSHATFKFKNKNKN